MVFKTNYYALVCSLPVLSSITEAPQGIDLQWFIENQLEHLTPGDRELVTQWVLFETNIMNVQRYSLGLFDEMHPLGWSKKLIEEDSKNEKPSVLPAFVVDYLQECERKEGDSEWIGSDYLWERAFSFSFKAPNQFIRNKFRFEYELKSILTVYRGKQKGLQSEGFLLQSDPEFTEQLVKDALGASDYGMGFKYDWAKKLSSLFEGNPHIIESRLDALRWDWLAENEPFLTPFQVEVVLAYLFRLVLVDRWRSLNMDEARQKVERLERMIADKLEI